MYLPNIFKVLFIGLTLFSTATHYLRGENNSDDSSSSKVIEYSPYEVNNTIVSTESLTKTPIITPTESPIIYPDKQSDLLYQIETTTETPIIHPDNKRRLQASQSKTHTDTPSPSSHVDLPPPTSMDIIQSNYAPHGRQLACASCAAGKYCSGSTCLTCAAGRYKTTTSGTAPCTTCVSCSAGLTYQTGACTATTNRVCTTCSTCPTGTRRSATCTITTNTGCTACIAAVSYTHLTLPTSDLV